MADKSFWSEKKDKTWLKNFWFYYGKMVIIGAIVAGLLIYGVVSCARTVDNDLLVYYMGSEHLDTEVYESTGKAFVELIDDADGKHGENALCIDMVISDNNEQATEMDMMMNTKVQIEMAEGDGYLYIMSQKMYDYCMQMEILEDISKYTGDETVTYGIQINDNKLMQSLGYETEQPLYMGVRVQNKNRVGKEIFEIKYNNAVKVIQYVYNNK